ncbi:MAG: leucyl aminopeptidase family protein [Acidimicrobiales bacterium]|nr:leucyl aminopeptidase family protein [Acidimicrobiales bacterium]
MSTSEVFSPIPSLAAAPRVTAAAAAPDATVLGVPVATSGGLPSEAGSDRATLALAGFDATVGSVLVLPPAAGQVVVLVGIGDAAALSVAGWRDAAAAFATAARGQGSLALRLPEGTQVPLTDATAASIEGVLLARYRYEPLHNNDALGRGTGATAVEQLVVVGGDGPGVARGTAMARATTLARDLANTPHSHLTATTFAELCVDLGQRFGFGVEVFDEDAIAELRLGGLMAVNRGSSEPPRMVRLSYRPQGSAAGRLGMVGKGIMYDSGGISIKPSNRVHAQMKNDMTGAATVIAAFTALADLGCANEVTGWLMCSDNMPSGTATGLGDVYTARNGTTVEVLDTDAEGRLVMADALVLAAESDCDAVVDIATLTGSVVRALGPDMAGVLGTDQGVVDQVKAAAAATEEPVWQMPLWQPYRRKFDRSSVADLPNIASDDTPDVIASSLFLSHFVGDTPWAHIDIAGPAQNEEGRTWHPVGCSGFGARLLAQLALDFEPTR